MSQYGLLSNPVSMGLGLGRDPVTKEPISLLGEYPSQKYIDELTRRKTIRQNETNRNAELLNSLLDFIPVVGDIKAANDVYDSYNQGNIPETALGLLGLGLGTVPVVGDVAAKIVKQVPTASIKLTDKELEFFTEMFDPKFNDWMEILEAAPSFKILERNGENVLHLDQKDVTGFSDWVTQMVTGVDTPSELPRSFLDGNITKKLNWED